MVTFGGRFFVPIFRSETGSIKRIPYICELGSCQFIEKGENIFFLGPTGTGKTHLAKAICHMVCRKYLTVRFFPFYQFFNELGKATLNNQQNKYLNLQ